MTTDMNVYGITGDWWNRSLSFVQQMQLEMQVFAGERFRYNPMANCIPNAYFERSTNGWINTELFFGWLANHFGKQVTIQPVVLLVYGHSSHIDLEVAKFCSKNQILLYCLPPHLSHLLQLLDVGYFRSFKSAWGKGMQQIQSKGIMVLML